MSDLIGRLAISHESDSSGNPISYTTPRNATMIRAEFALAQREAVAIDQTYGTDLGLIEDRDELAAMVARKTLVRGYMLALRDALTADLALRAAARENTPIELPAEPLNDVAPPADDRVPVLAALPGFVREGEYVVDGEGNRYARLTNPADRARELSAADVATLAAGTGRLAIPTDAGLRIPKAPLLASLGRGLAAANLSAGAPISFAEVGASFAEIARSGRNFGKHFLARRDRLAHVPGGAANRLPGGRIDGSDATAALQWQANNAETMLAALCGPGELDRDQMVCVNTDRVLANKFSPTAIGMGTHEWFRAIGLADFYSMVAAAPNNGQTGFGIWTSADQALVDPADPATWKQCFLLPDCPETMCVQAFFIYRCLKVCTEDRISRPQFIDNITTLMEALLARTAEGAILTGIDAWSFDRSIPNVTGYGAASHLWHALETIFSWITATARVDRGDYTLIVPEPLVNVARADLFHASSGCCPTGTDPGNLTSKIADMLSSHNVDLLVTPDWGLEGASMPMLPPQPYPGGPVDPNAGAPIPQLPTEFTVRLVPTRDFQHGMVGIEDYGVVTDAQLRRQNCAEFFGETAEIFYKKGCRPSFTFTLQDVCANGARPDRVAPYPCVPIAPAGGFLPQIPAGFPASLVSTNC